MTERCSCHHESQAARVGHGIERPLQLEAAAQWLARVTVTAIGAAARCDCLVTAAAIGVFSSMHANFGCGKRYPCCPSVASQCAAHAIMMI